MYNYSRKKGITLIELIVAIPIVVIVLSLTFSIYNFSNKVYKQSISKSDNQQDVRLIGDYIMKEVRNVKKISTNQANLSTEINYFSLSFVGQQLVKTTYTGATSTTSKIGAKITSLAFLPCDDKGMVKFNVSDVTNGVNFNSDFEFMVQNLAGNIIIPATPAPPTGTKYIAIYYAKN